MLQLRMQSRAGCSKCVFSAPQGVALRRVPEECPPKVEALVQRCLEYDPAARPTAREVVEELRWDVATLNPKTLPVQPHRAAHCARGRRGAEVGCCNPKLETLVSQHHGAAHRARGRQGAQVGCCNLKPQTPANTTPPRGPPRARSSRSSGGLLHRCCE